MTKPLTERLRMAAQSLRNLAPMWRKLYADSAENADRSAEAIDEAAKTLEEARALLERVSHLNSFRELNDFLPEVRSFLSRSN